MEKLKKLAVLCKHSLVIYFHPHRDFFQTVREYIAESDEDVPESIICEMERLDSVISLIYYPFGCVSSGCVIHYDLDTAIDEAIKGVIQGYKDRKLELPITNENK